MRRSRSRLAGSPAHHAKEVKYYAAAALKQYADSAGAASIGNCDQAFREFAKAASNDGKAAGHYTAAYVSSGARSKVAEAAEVEREEAHDAAYRAFSTNCVAPKSSPVNGLAGRRRKGRK